MATHIFVADPKLVNFNPYLVLDYVNYVRAQKYMQQLRLQQERLRNATLEAQKKGGQVLKQGQQVSSWRLKQVKIKSLQQSDYLAKKGTVNYIIIFKITMATNPVIL